MRMGEKLPAEARERRMRMAARFAARLREARGNIPQMAMARLLEMDQPMYCRFESGRSLPTAEVLYRICRLAGMRADWLLGVDDVVGSNMKTGNCATCELLRVAEKLLKAKQAGAGGAEQGAEND